MFANQKHTDQNLSFMYVSQNNANGYLDVYLGYVNHYNNISITIHPAELYLCKISKKNFMI